MYYGPTQKNMLIQAISKYAQDNPFKKKPLLGDNT